MKRVILNVVGFQIGWFSCVLGVAHGMPWLGPLVALPILAWHLFNAANLWAELKLLIVASLLGVLFDQTLLSAGLLRFADSAVWPVYLLPAWMMALWLLFNTTLNVGLRWLRGRMTIAVLFGLIGGPLAYLAGARLGAIKLLDMPTLLAVLGIGWGILMPILLWLSTIFDGYAPVDGAVAGALSDV